MDAEKLIQLIVNADDFGISSSTNLAIEKAHREGILTSASLMVNGGRSNDAVNIAKENPLLSVGIHLTLVCGRSTLKPSEIIGLVDDKFCFNDNPVSAGLHYFFRLSLRDYIRQEIHAQCREFRLTGLELDHLNGHLNFHLHPTVFKILKKDYLDLGIRSMRLTRDPIFANLGWARGRYVYRASHALIFNWLSKRAEKSLNYRSINYAQATFGLLQSGQITESYLLKLLAHLTPGVWELYCHPNFEANLHELDALTSPKVKNLIRERGIQLCRYSDIV
ncbi:MAG: ChbG/HpnK family deacetylase [Pedosphaera sp.]|nr:ChbG/HpnK family deacetylase [Pedosphaera sp.]